MNTRQEDIPDHAIPRTDSSMPPFRYIQRHTVSFLPPTQFLRIEHNIESPYDFGLSEFFIFLGILILCYIILIALIFGTIYAFFTLFH